MDEWSASPKTERAVFLREPSQQGSWEPLMFTYLVRQIRSWPRRQSSFPKTATGNQKCFQSFWKFLRKQFNTSTAVVRKCLIVLYTDVNKWRSFVSVQSFLCLNKIKLIKTCCVFREEKGTHHHTCHVHSIYPESIYVCRQRWHIPERLYI